MTPSARHPRSALLAALLLAAPLGACSTISETVKGPQLSAVAYPAQLMPVQQQLADARGDDSRPAAPNSLWRNGARAFFHDQRAAKIGDILTVNIDINDAAKVQNQTSASRKADNTVGIPHVLGLESTLGKIFPKGFDSANLVSTASDFSSDGQGATNRSEAITMTIAAVVSAVMPNGNLVIQGRQEVRINQELRELTIAGIVRPEDISASNTIRHTQIAEARVSYGGRGTLSRVQKTPAGTALLQTFSPF